MHLELKIVLLLTQYQQFNCTNLILQLKTSIYNFTFFVELISESLAGTPCQALHVPQFRTHQHRTHAPTAD